VSDTQTVAKQRALEHVISLLQMNPIQQGDAIIAARSTALGLVKKSSAAAAAAEAGGDPQAERRKLLERLEKLRAAFWTMPLDQLQRYLENMRGRGFADVEAAVTRLRVVAANRAVFPRLARERDFDGDLFSALKEVLIRSPRDTTVLKEQVLSSFRSREKRNRYRKMLQMLERELPAVYQLEADWFNALYRQKNYKAPWATTAAAGSGASGVGQRSGAVAAVLIAMAILGGLGALADRDGVKKKGYSGYPRTSPTPSYQNSPPPTVSYPPRSRQQTSPSFTSQADIDEINRRNQERREETQRKFDEMRSRANSPNRYGGPRPGGPGSPGYNPPGTGPGGFGQPRYVPQQPSFGPPPGMRGGPNR
jgi:hypothetical protein